MPQSLAEKRDMMSKKKKIRISDSPGYTKNTCAKFHDKILNGYLEKLCTYAIIGPKIPQNDPQQREGMM